MENCIFCKIANKEINSDIVYEDENIIAFKDLNPKANTHILVIPKKHYNSLNEIDDEFEKIDFLSTIAKISKIANIDKTGYRIISNIGNDSHQEVKHLHFHVLGGNDLGDIV